MATKVIPVNERYDVIIYEIESGRVDTIAGKDMPLDSGSFHTAEKRLETVLPRLNGHYNAAIVPAGVYSVGKTYRA
jgi:hypothetical protein